MPSARCCFSRQQSIELQQIIQDRISDENKQIADLRQQIEQEEDIEKKENLYNQIDKIEETIDTKISDVLDELLPRAFAIIKDTARRFKEHTEVEVTATQFDRDIAAVRDSVEIRGDKAIWFNTWTAGIRGNEATAKIPVLIVSADSEQADEDKAMAMGANHYFEKPLQLNAIVEKVKSILA